MSLPYVSMIGNLTRDPELKWTASGVAVASFTVAASERKRTDSGEWVDGDVVFLDVSAWRQLGENVAESLAKGDRVSVTGRLKSRKYEAKDGSERVAWSVDADDVSLSLARATAKVQRTSRTSTTTALEPSPWDTHDAPGF